MKIKLYETEHEVHLKDDECYEYVRFIRSQFK